MTHWRSLLESEVIRYVDLGDQEYTLKISKVVKGKVVGKSGQSKGRAMIHFEGRERPLAAGTAILETIGRLYGNDTRQWPNKWITIYPDHSVMFGSEKVGGIRVRNEVPKVAGDKKESA